ncbi:MAG: HAD-IB family phosphatase [Bacilli bacterium]|nr:HAD-IB family phosphatase [Bacilli bacterium]
MKINLFDFDGTIYDGDSTVDFIKYIIKRNPLAIIWLPFMGFYGLLYILRFINKTIMKQGFYKIFMFVKIDKKFLDDFWNIHEKKIKKFYIDRNHKNDIIISASPEFLLRPICNKLGVMDLIGSVVNQNIGTYTGINCHDVEKVRRLNEKYSDYKVIESYSDSIKSDKPILKLAEKAYLVKKDDITLINFDK